MKKTIRFIVLAVTALLSFNAFAIKGCDEYVDYRTREQCNFAQQRYVADMINAHIREIVYKPEIYGEKISKHVQETAVGNFNRIKDICKGNNDCLYEAYSELYWEYDDIVQKGKANPAVRGSTYQEKLQKEKQKRQGGDPLKNIPQYNSNHETGS